jgi:mono/diheme cytochrome c family protein
MGQIIVQPKDSEVAAGTPLAQPSGTHQMTKNGVYIEAQAQRGHSEYLKSCAQCHMDSLGGQEQTPPLVGEAFQGHWQGRSIGNLYDRIRFGMRKIIQAA